ncbi:MAG: dihydropteroate synthase [Alphaproteobacteria bacterium]|nr:dihydropteroate synthase [Alphaproteobacteria bacterium]
MSPDHSVAIDLPSLLSGAATGPLWLRPLGIMTGAVARLAVERGVALKLAGTALAFDAVEVVSRAADAIVTTVTPLHALMHAFKGEPALRAKIESALHQLSRPRPNWAGFTLDRPRIMGILNVTPDSFSDGGRFLDPERAIAHGRALVEAGADIIDVGGESTRPGAAPITPEDEIGRIEPVVRALAATGAAISVDTRHPKVMARALEAGGRIINDTSALLHPGSLAVAAKAKAPIVLMHMQGEPATMQHAPQYDLPSLDIIEYLEARIGACIAAGIARDAIVIDPGIGFGKTKAHNLEILAHIALFHALGTGILIGASRKSFLGMEARDRLPGSLAVAIHAVRHGVQILRVHDVAETRAAIALTEALDSAS